MRASVLIPARSGGWLLENVVERVREQQADFAFEVVIVDSGSPDDELARLRALGAKVVAIPPREFDHGATRDLLAEQSSGELLVYLNQDALPVGHRWLALLVEQFDRDPGLAAVQGLIAEIPSSELATMGRTRFFWDSCGGRFYFTRESEGWIARHGGIGFSTVHCAIARQAWERVRFGYAAILEDKLWQKRALASGLRIATAGEAAVWHTHDYDLRGLLRRCASEGYGWRLVGERYSLRTALRDLRNPPTWREWRRGLRAGELSSWAERLFPIVRPLAVWWGNRWATRVLHG